MKLFTKIFSPLIHHQANADALLLSEQLNRQDHHALIFPDFLQSITLDYSLISLRKLDHYLHKVRAYFQLANQQTQSTQQHTKLIDEMTRVVLRVGAYLGETIRQQNKKWIWIENKKENYTKSDVFKTSILLLTDHNSLTSPMQEVINFICTEQKPTSLYQYAWKVLSS
jgi:hypothetical protein